eukprot:m.364181 g.364181  ORF g.364181 m.364181 type:complete len:509 (-) comp25902_c0_seq1:232-1758(-)
MSMSELEAAMNAAMASALDESISDFVGQVMGDAVDTATVMTTSTLTERRTLSRHTKRAVSPKQNPANADSSGDSSVQSTRRVHHSRKSCASESATPSTTSQRIEGCVDNIENSKGSGSVYQQPEQEGGDPTPDGGISADGSTDTEAKAGSKAIQRAIVPQVLQDEGSDNNSGVESDDESSDMTAMNPFDVSILDDLKAFRFNRLQLFHEHLRSQDDINNGRKAIEPAANDTVKQWHLAVAKADYHTLRELVSNDKLLVTRPDPFAGCTIIHYAARRNDKTLLQIALGGSFHLCLDKRNHAGNTALHVAYSKNINDSHADIIHHLTHLGASTTVKNWKGWVPEECQQRRSDGYLLPEMPKLPKIDRPIIEGTLQNHPTLVVESDDESAVQRRSTFSRVASFFNGSRRRKKADHKSTSSDNVLSTTQDKQFGSSFRGRASSVPDLLNQPAPIPESGALFSPPSGAVPFTFARAATERHLRERELATPSSTRRRRGKLSKLSIRNSKETSV